MTCEEKYKDKLTSQEYIDCKAKADEQAIKDDYFESIKITDEDNENIVTDLRNNKKQKFKSAKYRQEGFGTMAGGPKMILRSEEELKDLLGSDYELYQQYLNTEDQNTFFDEIKLKEEDITAARNSRVKMKSRTYMEGVEDDDRKALLTSFGEEYESNRKKIDTATFLVEKANKNAQDKIEVITGKEEDVLKDGKKIKKTYGGIDNTLRLMKKSLDLAREKGQEPSQAFFDKYNELLEQRDGAVVAAESAIKKIEVAANNQIKAVGNLEKPMQGINAFKRNYSNIETLKTGIQRAVLSVNMAGAELGEFATVYGKATKNFISGDFGQMIKGLAEYDSRDSGGKSSDSTINMFRDYREGLLDAKEYLNYKQANFLPETVDLDDIKSVGDFLRYSGDAVLNNLPQIAMSMAGPYVGTALFVASGTGEKSAELGLEERGLQDMDVEGLKKKLKTTTDPFEKMYIEQELARYDKVMNMSQTTKFLGATGHGLAEGVFERAFGSIKIIEGMADAWKFIPKEKIGKSLLRTAGYLPTTAGMESLSEGGTQIAQNMFDRYLFKNDVSIFQDLDESMVQGFIIGKGFALVKGAPNMYGAILNASQTSKDKKLLKGKAQELNSVLKNLNDPEQAKNLTADGRRQLEVKASELQNDIVSSADASLDKLSKLSVDQIFEVGDIDRQMSSINKQYVQAVQSGMSEKALAIIKKDLQTEFSSLQNQKANVLETKVDESTLEGNLKEAKTINNLAKSLNFAVEGAQRLGVNAETNLTVDQIKEKYGDEAAQSAGFYDKKTNTLVVNTEIALNTGSVTVGEHEMLHGILKTLPIDKLNTIKKDLESNLNKDQKVVMDKIMNQVDKDGNKLYSDTYLETNPDEYIVQLSDAITNGDIKIEDDAITKIGDFIKQVFVDLGFKKLKFDTASDVRLFLKNYQKSIKSGKLSGAVVKSIGKIEAGDDIDIATLNPQTPEGKKFQDDVQNLYTDGKFDQIIPKYRKSVTNNLLAEFPFLQNLTNEADIAKREAVIDDILNNPDRGVASVVFKYDRSRGVPLSGAIGSIIAGSSAKRKRQYSEFVQKEFAPNIYEDSSDAAQRQAEQKLDDTSTKEDKTVERKKINPLKSNLAKGKVKEIETIVNIKPEEITTLTYKDVGRKFGNKVASEIFNVPVDKISDGKKNLTYAKKINIDGVPQASEAGNIQNAYTSKQDAKNFIKTLPPTNVTSETATIGNEIKDVSRNVQGIGIGLNKKILDFFYQDTGKRSKGVTSQTAVKELKPKFKGEISSQAIVDFQNEMGITPAGTLNNYDRGIGQFLKGVAKVEGAKVANTVVRQKIDKLDIKTAKPKSQIKADIAAGKSDLVFLKKNITKMGKDKFGENYITLDNKNPNHKKIFKDFLTNQWTKYIPAITLKSVNFASAGNRPDLIAQYGAFLSGIELKKIKAKAIKNQGNFTPEQIKAVSFANKQKSFTTIANTASYLSDIKLNYEGLFFVLDQFQKMYNDATGDTIIVLNKKQKSIPNKAIVASFLGAFLNGASSSSKHLLRQAAMPFMVAQGLTKPKKGIAIAEHNVQSNVAADIIFEGIINNDLAKMYPFLKENYYQSLIPKVDDNKMSDSDGKFGEAYNFDDVTPKEVVDGMNKFKRTGNVNDIVPILIKYFNPLVNNNNGGLNPNVFIFKGKPLSEIYNVSVPKSLQKNNLIISKQQDLIYNQLLGNEIDLKELNNLIKTLPQAELVSNTELKTNKVLENGRVYMKANPNSIPKNIDPNVLNTDINQMIQDTKGIKAKYRFSDIVAKRRGAGVRNFKLIASGAQDFSGLMYDLYGRGKKGEAQQKWVKDNLVKPYQDGIAKIDKYRQALKNDYSALLKQYPNVSNKLGDIVPGTEFTLDQALRVNLWTQGGFEIPGLSKRDIKKLNDIVNKDPELKLFNESALAITKQPKWVAPSPHWDVESLISDLNSLTTKVGRKEYLAEFIANKNAIFSKENLNKMEVALGTNWREAMEDSLYRMENGTNRPSGTNRLTNNFLNWVNNSVGAIMFMNVKSALLQTISSVNFLNWSDNNPFKAALALANFPQYVKDFSFLWNSPKLVQRRSGLRKDINEAELANAAQGAKNKPAAMLSYLLKLGFTPTQLADSFAIASGGATFYRNRLNTYKKQGLSEQEASDKAFEDFAEASDVAQQSADPMLISQQQASVLGRLLLAFQNTPAQVTRIFNKASRDFINNRGDQKTNVSKMIYYGAVQGFIFAALQNAAFALIPGFDDEEDEEKKSKEFDKKEERILNSMVDTMLRGSGVYGAIVSTLKNTALTYYREEKKDAFGKDHRNTLLEILNLSPPVGSKLRKINNAIKAKDYNEEVVKEQGWDVTLKGKVNLSPSYQVIASLTEAITNLPLERAVIEIDRVVEMLDARNTTFQRVALALGYRTWDVNTKNEERDLVKIESKEAKEKARKQKVIDDRAERKRLKELEKYKGKTKEEIKQMKRRDSIVGTNKSDQITSLKNLGLTTKQIKELKYEDDRVNKIIELTNK